MQLRLRDPNTPNLRVFQLLKNSVVGLSTCDLTLYDYAQLGYLRTYIFEDLLHHPDKSTSELADSTSQAYQNEPHKRIFL